MKHRTRFIRLFWISMAALGIGVTVLGGCVAWKLIHSATPKIENATVDPEQLLERTVAARQAENSAVTTDTETEETTSTGNKISSTSEEEYEEFEDDEYYDEDYDEEEDIEGQKSLQNEQKSEFSYTLEDVSNSSKSSQTTAKKKTGTSQYAKPKMIFASYEQGLLQCQKSQAFPCVWKDNSGPLVKQYLLKSSHGPVERIIYMHDGKIISQTFSRLDGVVTYYQGTFAELYFENGLLTKMRTYPYDNPNLRDWFLIDKSGKISACLCGIPTKDCCARSSLYKEGGHRKYCDLFPRDPDFCTK